MNGQAAVSSATAAARRLAAVVRAVASWISNASAKAINCSSLEVISFDPIFRSEEGPQALWQSGRDLLPSND